MRKTAESLSLPQPYNADAHANVKRIAKAAAELSARHAAQFARLTALARSIQKYLPASKAKRSDCVCRDVFIGDLPGDASKGLRDRNSPQIKGNSAFRPPEIRSETLTWPFCFLTMSVDVCAASMNSLSPKAHTKKQN